MAWAIKSNYSISSEGQLLDALENVKVNFKKYN
jgi:hypothetical protein